MNTREETIIRRKAEGILTTIKKQLLVRKIIFPAAVIKHVDLVKPFDFRELLVRIRAVLNHKVGSTFVLPDILRYADLAMNNQTKTVSRSGKAINLTPKS